MGDTFEKFMSSARRSGGKERFRRRVRKRLMDFVGEWRMIDDGVIEPSEGDGSC